MRRESMSDRETCPERLLNAWRVITHDLSAWFSCPASGAIVQVHFTCIARLSLLIIAVWKPGSTYADRAFPGNLTSTGQLPYSWRLSPLLPN